MSQTNVKDEYSTIDIDYPEPVVDSQATIPFDEYGSMEDLFGSDSESDLLAVPEVKTKKEVKTPAPRKELSKKEIALAVHLQQVASDFVIHFLEEHRVKNGNRLVTLWKTEENQDQLAGMLKFHAPSKTKKIKAPKDPNAPKRPLSAYIMYCQAKRQKVRAKHTEMKAVEVTKKLAAKWQLLSDERKVKYNLLATEDKKRYAKEMKVFVPTPVDQLPVPRKRGRPSTKKKREGPKRARTAYIFFCTEKRPEARIAHPELTGKEVTTELGRMWKKDFPDRNARKTWRRAARKDKKRYAEEKATWNAEHSTDMRSPSPAPAKKKAKKTKPVVSPYISFARDQRATITIKHPTWSTARIAKKVKRRWNKLSEEEHAEYGT